MVFILLGLSISIFAITMVALTTAFANQFLAKRGRVYIPMKPQKTGVAQEFDIQHRDPRVIQSTVTAWIQMTYEWDNQIPGSEAVDQGVQVDRQVVVPTKAYFGSYLLQDGLRDVFLKQLGSTIIPKNVATNAIRSVVRFYSISTPTKISDSKWQLDVVATRTESSPSQMLWEVPMNWTITVQAIPYVPLVFGMDEPLVWRQKIYELLSYGLMITNIAPLRMES